MNRFAFAPALALLWLLILASNAVAQAKPAPSSAAKSAAPAAAPAQAPATPAKFVKPIKGVASIQFMQISSKKVGPDIVTVLKIRNISPGAISLLKVDEYWYDKGKPPQVVTGDSQRYRKPFLPGEIIEITMNSPYKPNLLMSQYQFSHANGGIDVKRVKKFE
jgi:hypothetical protein